MSYDFCLFGSLYLAYAAAVLQLVLAFTPRFSVLTLGNALLLATAYAPLATNRLDLGSRVGFGLWLGNLVFVFVLFARWAAAGDSARAGLPVLGSLLGLAAFGLHVFVFASVP
jgi:hypothetical protein